MTGARLGALLCAAMLTGTWWAASAVTGGFAYWTFEELRRAEARSGRMQAGALSLDTADGRRLVPWQTNRSDRTIYVVDFIYARCPSVCSVLGSEYGRMQALLARAEASVRLLSISFDLEHDNDTELRIYAKRNGASLPFWWVARPANAQAAQRLLRELGVVVIPDGAGGYVHNGALHLVDARGELKAVLDYGDWQQAITQARALAETPERR